MSEYVPAVLLTLAVCVVLVGLVALGWRHRLRRQGHVPAPAAVPAGLSEPHVSVDGQYVSTTTAGDWLDRIAVHSLGFKANAVLTVHPEGALYARDGAPDVFVPVADLTSVRRESGMAGKFVERDGLIVAEWRLGGLAVDTGFRPRFGDDGDAAVAAIDMIIAAHAAEARGPQNNHDVEKKDTK
ncbi:PH-like domain-containing protein [Zhihengliuella salsuginis]|uniref:PH domain-containing protein n=1 Tax=Zhihengliuella salsuginis TaxID=578222 RepID=A0ABQ3GCV9_9MICC|nr:hypothetical protein [Zhihengliuella salsuginis]GHD02001.1 hypothetical protein GCM10008096_06740 [Zhihengliuella salsuginis]